jgi:hypothetical protein
VCGRVGGAFFCESVRVCVWGGWVGGWGGRSAGVCVCVCGPIQTSSACFFFSISGGGSSLEEGEEAWPEGGGRPLSKKIQGKVSSRLGGYCPPCWSSLYRTGPCYNSWAWSTPVSGPGGPAPSARAGGEASKTGRPFSGVRSVQRRPRSGRAPSSSTRTRSGPLRARIQADLDARLAARAGRGHAGAGRAPARETEQHAGQQGAPPHRPFSPACRGAGARAMEAVGPADGPHPSFRLAAASMIYHLSW